MQALEKSIPRDRRGSTEPGTPYEADESSLGESGTRLMRLVVKFAVLELLTSLDGICKLSPRAGKLGRLGVTGDWSRQVSSFETLGGSRNAGEGESARGLRSIDDHGRGFDGVLET